MIFEKRKHVCLISLKEDRKKKNPNWTLSIKAMYVAYLRNLVLPYCMSIDIHWHFTVHCLTVLVWQSAGFFPGKAIFVRPSKCGQFVDFSLWWQQKWHRNRLSKNIWTSFVTLCFLSRAWIARPWQATAFVLEKAGQCF